VASVRSSRTGATRRIVPASSPSGSTAAEPARIEQAIGKLKRFKRIAPRCEKAAENYAALIAFVCGRICVKSVHMA
jgi:transposase